MIPPFRSFCCYLFFFPFFFFYSLRRSRVTPDRGKYADDLFWPSRFEDHNGTPLPLRDYRLAPPTLPRWDYPFPRCFRLFIPQLKTSEQFQLVFQLMGIAPTVPEWSELQPAHRVSMPVSALCRV